jgi:hypothetical protein
MTAGLALSEGKGEAMLPVGEVLLGLLVLLAGRRLYWLLVAVAGFLAGLVIVNAELTAQPSWLTMLFACGAGLLGALLALLLQRLAFAVVGFFAGAYLGLAVAQAAALPSWSALLWLLGGLVGLIAAILLTDWALIVLSSAVGAAAIAAHLPLEGASRPLVTLALIAVGTVIQGRQLEPAQPTTPPAAT